MTSNVLIPEIEGSILNYTGFQNLTIYSGKVLKIIKETEKKVHGAGMISFPVGDFLNLGLGNIFTEKIKNTEIFLKRDDNGLDVYYNLPNCDFIGIEGHEIVILGDDKYPLLLLNLSMNQKTICPHSILAKLAREAKVKFDSKKKLQTLLQFLNQIPNKPNLSFNDLNEISDPLVLEINRKTLIENESIEARQEKGKKIVGYFFSGVIFIIGLANLGSFAFVLGSLLSGMIIFPPFNNFLKSKNIKLPWIIRLLIFLMGLLILFVATSLKTNTSLPK